MDADDHISLPSLAPHLKLSRAPDERGDPFWTIHDPVANTYFKIDWMAFEIISRMSKQPTYLALKNSIERETTLKITSDDIKSTIGFLDRAALLSIGNQTITGGLLKKQPFWRQIFHHYLYFSLPLFKPQKFLEKTYPYVRWAFSSIFLKAMMTFLIVMILFTMPRVDEFFHTFSALLSAEGAVAALITLFFVKVIHEFAHAYAAIRHGVKIPHMGVAFIIMYPVLYTETTGSWALPNRRARFHIGMAGIMAELCLAAIFLIFWHMAPTGSIIQSLSFLVIFISLVGSLLINLNPFMRFDGYYMFSDAVGFDNLQTRSCQFARHSLRRILFGWQGAPPEDLPVSDQKFLTIFGFALLIYRFFLFLGIALLVYHIFFQPLGFILMAIELMWFIFLPIWSEVKIWYQQRNKILSSKRSLVPMALLISLLAFVSIPWKSTITLPAIAHAGRHENMYAPSPAMLVKLNIKEGQKVREDEVLAHLESPDLDFKLKSAKQELSRLEILQRRGQNMIEAMKNNELSDVAIEKLRIKVTTYQDQKDRLIIKAPFSGIIRDIGIDVKEGRYINNTDALFTIINPEETQVTAFATETEREHIKKDSTALFISEFKTLEIPFLSIVNIDKTGTSNLQWPELASIHGGPIAADQNPEFGIVTRRTLYEITAHTNQSTVPLVERGYLKISSAPSSLLSNWIKYLIAIMRNQGNAR